MDKILARAAKIKLLICDVDGVLTDGSLYLNKSGDVLMRFHVHDGFGLQLLMCSGVAVGIVTSSNLPLIDSRMQQLGITDYFKGHLDKAPAYQTLKSKFKCSDEQIAYMGDDLTDLPFIRHAGLGVSVPGAIEVVRANAAWITTQPGGHGAVRELCELIMQAQNTTETAFKTLLASKQA